MWLLLASVYVLIKIAFYRTVLLEKLLLYVLIEQLLHADSSGGLLLGVLLILVMLLRVEVSGK